MKPGGIVFDSSWRKDCQVQVCPRSEVDFAIRAHYLGKWPGVCVLVLALRRGIDVLGAVVFALPPRETAVRYGAVTWELARLWVADAVPTNAESWLLAKAIRYVRRTRPEVKVLVSYADPSAGHTGVVYKASNWKSDGRTDDDRRTPRFDYVCALSGKKFGRKSHVPEGVEIVRVPRVSKNRFVYFL